VKLKDVPENLPVSPGNAGASFGQHFLDNKVVDDRVNRSISGYVGTPSPFEDVDKEDLKDIKAVAGEKSPALAALPAQARDTVSGSATQDSFLQQQSAPLRKKTASVHSAFGGLGARAQNNESPQEWKGATSGMDTFRTVAVRSAVEWQALWQQVTRSKSSPSPSPSIDFSRFMVIGIFSGTKPTAGYAVDIVEVQVLPDKIAVTYRETSPAPEMAAAQVVTQPYILRVVPQSVLPVSFDQIP
jgi:hypothetical protein